MSSHRVRLAAVVATAVLAVCAAGCSDDDDPSGAPSTSTVTTTEDVETTVATTTSTVPPTTHTTHHRRHQRPRCRRRLRRRRRLPRSRPTTGRRSSPSCHADRVALYAAPDLARIGEYCVPASDCARQLEAQLGDAIAKGQHIEGQQPFTIVASRRSWRASRPPLGARHRRRSSWSDRPPTPPPRIVDANGNVGRRAHRINDQHPRRRSRLAKWDDPVLPWRVVSVGDAGTGVAMRRLLARSPGGDVSARALAVICPPRHARG